MEETRCPNCGCSQPYRVKIRDGEGWLNGFRVPYMEEVAMCAICCEEVYAADVDARNRRHIEEAYHELNNLA